MDEKNHATLTGSSPVTNSTPNPRSKRSMGLVRRTLGVCALVLAVALSACSPTANTPAPTFSPPAPLRPQQTATPTLAPTQAFTFTPAVTSTPQVTATPTPLDPCLLISSQEASTLAGASFGKGAEVTTSSGLRICTYGSQTVNVFTVDVIQAPDIATAKAAKAQFLADIQANLAQLTNQGLNVTEVPNFADGAPMATASVNVQGIAINGSAFAFLKGTIFFGFSDLVEGGAAPSSAAMQSEANTVLGRLP